MWPNYRAELVEDESFQVLHDVGVLFVSLFMKNESFYDLLHVFIIHI